MRWCDARATVEQLRRCTTLWLPALTMRRGFSSTRIEHLLHALVAQLPANEVYLEVGSLEGRTLDAAATGNDQARIVACDPGAKYGTVVDGLPPHVMFHALSWDAVLPMLSHPLGCAFYDADHSAEETLRFLRRVPTVAADECVIVLDDWDRQTVRDAATTVLSLKASSTIASGLGSWHLLAEMPEYGDGLTCPPNHFGYYFGCAVLGWRR